MDKIQEFVEKLSHEDILKIMEQYEEYCSNGFIGEERLRILARELGESLGAEGRYITTWMRDLHHEVCRFLAKKYLTATGGHIFEDRDC